jgi:hypothetical protein
MAQAPPPPPPPPAGSGGGMGDTLPPRTLGDVLSGAWNVLIKNAAQLLLIVAIVVIPLSFLNALLRGVVFAPTKETENILGQQITVTHISTGALWAGLIIAPLIGILISALLQAALLRGAALGTLGETVNIEESYKWGFRRIGSVIWISLLEVLIIALGAVVGIALIFLVPALAFIWALAILAYVLFMWTMLAVSIPALVIENRRGVDALGRSWNLVKPHFWHTLGILVVTAIIVGIVAGIIGAIGGYNWIVSWITSSIGQILTAPFSALVTVILYLDLRARTESLTSSGLRAELAADA